MQSESKEQTVKSVKEHSRWFNYKKKVCEVLSVFGAFTIFCMIFGDAAMASNADAVITAQFDVLLDIVTSIVSSIGTIVTLWGISEWGIAFQGQDGTSQAHAFKRIAGGLVMILAPQLLTLF